MDNLVITDLLKSALVSDDVIQELIKTAKENKTLDQLKDGDLVFKGDTLALSKIDRVTPTQIKIGDNKYRKDGSLIGYEGFSGFRHALITINPKTLEEYTERKLAVVKNRHIDSMVANLQLRKLSYQQVMELFQVFKDKGIIQ